MIYCFTFLWAFFKLFWVAVYLEAFSQEFVFLTVNYFRKLAGSAFSESIRSLGLKPELAVLFTLFWHFFSVRQTLMFSIPVSFASPISEETSLIAVETLKWLASVWFFNCWLAMLRLEAENSRLGERIPALSCFWFVGGLAWLWKFSFSELNSWKLVALAEVA